jgi:SAM-dependent methyltransferase
MEIKEKYKCRICGKKIFSNAHYPEIHFNNKVFKYYKCVNCKSYNVFPTPNSNDFSKMYGEIDHSYLKNLKSKLSYNFDFPFANHQAYQIKYLKKNSEELKGKLLLDYGCGSGFYMKYSEKLGAKTVGIEFDEKFVEILKDKTDLEIYTFSKFSNKYKNIKFDFIHLGHILEHLPNPNELVLLLYNFATNETVFLIDGPLERNFCLSRVYVDLGSFIKNKKQNEISPQHLSLTNKKSQILFFSDLGLIKDKYYITEQYFPLPNKFSKSMTSNISYLIASFSIILSKIIPCFGNAFHYRGKINKTII